MNNLGNHYVLCGDAEKARSYFERVLQAECAARQRQSSTGAHRRGPAQGARALEYLARVDDPQPAARLLRAEALHWAGNQGAALAMLDGLQKEAGADKRLGLPLRTDLRQNRSL